MANFENEQGLNPAPPFRFENIDFNPGVEIAPSIYEDSAHQVTNFGCIVSAKATAELQRFSREYSLFLGVDWQPYMRMDIYPTTESLAVLEVNTSFVDGWGIALNLSRAAGQCLSTDGRFPNRFAYQQQVYRPELELLIDELTIQGHEQILIEAWDNTEPVEPTYVYGRVELDSPNVLPRRGLQLDNKLNLSRFAKIWRSQLVEIPESFLTEEGTEWQDIPPDVYLKFTDKSSDESKRAKFSVLRGRPEGKARFLRAAYASGKLIAQREVPAWRELVELPSPYCPLNKAVQLVVLAQGDFLAGYVQYSQGWIINDNSIHAPLLFE